MNIKEVNQLKKIVDFNINEDGEGVQLQYDTSNNMLDIYKDYDNDNIYILTVTPFNENKKTIDYKYKTIKGLTNRLKKLI